ncbi:MAG: GtrA family protein [Lachnospiraceae bacterium]
MKKYEALIKQVLRFGVVGGMAFLIDYVTLFLLTEFVGINYLISGAISFVLSVIFSYILSVRWVYQTNRKMNKRLEFIVFVILSLIGLGINQAIMWLGVDKMGYYYMIVKIFATAIVMVYNFVTRKLFLEERKTA